MTNSFNKVSYFIIYLIIILILIYTITFMSSYTCNISHQPFDLLNNHENFETSTITNNDFIVVGIGSDNTLYAKSFNNASNSSNTWIHLPNSGFIYDICFSNSYFFVAVGINGFIWTKSDFNSPWIKVNSQPNKQLYPSWTQEAGLGDNNWKFNFNSIFQLNNGSFYATDGFGNGYTNTNLQTGTWIIQNNAMINPPGQNWPNSYLQLIQGPNNIYYSIFGIPPNSNLYSSNDLIHWQGPIQNTKTISRISVAPNGIFFGIFNNNIYYTNNLGNQWTLFDNSQHISSVCIVPLKPTIGNYTRIGAFNENTPRTLPNLIGNFNSIVDCVNAAQSQGYNTVGYQFMTQCWAGNDVEYDKYGPQSNLSNSIDYFPGGWTNIVYKTTDQLITTQEPEQGEVFIYEKCQFLGSGSKMIIGNYPDFESSIPVLSLKVGIYTNVELFELPNYQGNNLLITGYSDIVNKIHNCLINSNNTFSSAKVTPNNKALPSKPINLTKQQLTDMWISVGCNPESSIINNSSSLANWQKSFPTTESVIQNMKRWATSQEQFYKTGCYMPSSEEDSPTENEVVLYENNNYQGRYKKFGLGNFAFVGNDFNNITNSITIGPYTSVTIFENINFGGKSLTFKNDSSTISGINSLISNNFNNLLSSLKVNLAFEPVNYNLSLQAVDVVVLGSFNSYPWNLSKFVDSTAKWIWWNNWNDNFPKGNAPTDNKPIRFQLLVPITGKFDIPVVIHVIADNAPQNANIIKVNNKIVGQIDDYGWTTPKYTQIQTNLAPGSNLIEFDVQNTSNTAGLLVSIINSNTNDVIANSGSGKWGWIDPTKLISATLSEIDSNLIIHDEAAVGKIVKIKDINDLFQLSVGGTFRLVVELKDVPPYIKGQQFNKGDTNEFYLAIEKLDPNCSITEENGCLNVYADNKKCNNNALTNVTKKNSFRLVLISKDYVLDPNIPFGKNVDFTMVKIADKYYLKNIQTGFFPKLYKNDFNQNLYGYIDTGYLSNYNSLNNNTNKLCNNNNSSNNKNNIEQENLISTITNSEFVSCTTNSDGNMYLMTTSNLLESNPIKFVVNKDGYVSMSLQMFNFYGTPDQSYSLVFCNFNVNTYAYIEKLTNPLGTFLVNMVCFDSDKKRRLPNNTLNFKFEISKYPTAYLKEKNIYNLNN